MDVMVGPTFTIDVSSSPTEPPTAADRPNGLFCGDSSQSSSSIGTPDDSDDDDDDDDENDVVSSKRNPNDDEEEEVHNKLKVLASLDSLEDSLPIKRGLSNHFMGKSKSFTDLSQVNTLNTAKELQKQENPLNKRRRVQIASKWSRKSSFYTWSNPKSMPLLPVHEDDDYFEEEEPKKVSPSSSSSTSEEKKQEEDQVLVRPQRVPVSYAHHLRARFGSFKSRSLSDLKEHDEEEEDEDNDDE